MALVDSIFIQNARDIIENGTTTENQKVRPHWEDGTPAYTIKRFGVCNRYDLRKEFPLLTLRKIGIKSAYDEILWIYQRKSNNIHDLKPHIWDKWADENGSIGKAYGYQAGRLIPISKVEGEYQKWDQVDLVLAQLRDKPFDRRIMLNIWNWDDLPEMRLQPCCWSMNFNVTDEGGDKLVLNAVLNQRSNDFLAANNWNVVQYALLLKMFAQVSNMEAGVLVHMITDQHIYDRHVNIVKDIIKLPVHEAAKVELDPDVKDFYDFTYDSLTVKDYNYSTTVKDIPIAI